MSFAAKLAQSVSYLSFYLTLVVIHLIFRSVYVRLLFFLAVFILKVCLYYRSRQRSVEHGSKDCSKTPEPILGGFLGGRISRTFFGPHQLGRQF